MSRSNLTLLTPPQEKEEIHPYRRPWRSFSIEAGVLLAVTALLYVLTNVLGVALPARLYLPLGLALTALPVGLWLTFSWWPERFVPQPRQRLLAVAVVSGLVANAVGLPLVNDLLQVDRWLPLASAINRIIGYTFTAGIVQELLKYLVVRYTVWPDCFRTRLDAVAYGAASAVGYAAVLNLNFVLTTAPPPDVAAARIFDTMALHLVTSLIVGYGLAEIRFGLPTPLFLASTLALAAFVTGVAIPVRAGMINPTFGIPADPVNPVISAPRALFGIGFAAALLLAFAAIIAFLYASAERREREAAVED